MPEQAPYQITGEPPAAPSSPAASSQAAPTPAAQPATQPKRLASTSEFAAAIRKAHPGAYDGVDDAALTHAVVTKYPVYRDRVVDIYAGAEGVKLPELGNGTRPPTPPPQPTMSTKDSIIATVGDAIASPYTGGKKMLQGAVEAGRILNQLPNDAGVVQQQGEFSPMQPGEQGPQQPLSAEALARPFADLTSGAMEAGELALIPGIVLAPEVTLPALAVGTGASEVARYGADKAGAPPAVSELVANLAGLVAGVVAGERISAFKERQAAIPAERQAMIDQATQTRQEVAVMDTAAANAERMGARFEADAQVRAAAQADADLAAAEAEAAAQKAQALEDYYHQQALNAGLIALADEHSAARAQVGGSPFEYLSAVDVISTELQAARDGVPQQLTNPRQLLQDFNPRVGNAAHVEGPPADYDLSGPPPLRPGVMSGAPPEAPTLAPGDRAPQLIEDLGKALEEHLQGAPPETPEQIGARRMDRAMSNAARDMASRLSDNKYDAGGMADAAELSDTGETTRRYQAGHAADQVYRAIVGAETKSAPPVQVIADILQLYADTGAKTAAELPADKVAAMRAERVQAKGGAVSKTLSAWYAGPKKFLNAYDRWMPEVMREQRKIALGRKHIEGLMKVHAEDAARMEAERGRLVPGSKPPAGVGPEGPEGPPELPDGPGSGGRVREAGAPPDAGALPDDMPADWLSDVLGDGEQQPLLPGAESVRNVENPTPAFEAPFTLDHEAVPTGEAGTAQPKPQTFWDALKSDLARGIYDEEGALKFGVDPNDETAVRKWLRGKAAEFGHEAWHEQATTALEEGDLKSATRIISVAVAKSHLAAAATLRKEQPTPANLKAMAVIDDAVERTRMAHQRQIEAEIGGKLKASVTVTPDGTLKFALGGKDVPAIRARATDLTMGHSLNKLALDYTDPTQILRMGLSDEVDPQFQVSKQVADQAAREWTDDQIQEFSDLLGFGDRPLAEQRQEVGRQIVRSASLSAKTLGEFGHFVRANMDLMYALDPRIESGAVGELGSVGAMQAKGITTPDSFVRWIGEKAGPEDLDALQFKLPKGTEMRDEKGRLTSEAKIYARNWFRRMKTLEDLKGTVERLVGKEGSALDRAAVLTTLAPKLGERGGSRWQALNGLSKGLLIMRPSTAVKNAISQSGRYSSGMADEAMAALLSLASGNRTQARVHSLNLKYLAEGFRREGTSSLNLFKHPWAEGLEATYNLQANAIATLPPEHASKTLSLMSQLPRQESRFMGALALEDGEPGMVPEHSSYRAIAAMQKAVDAITKPEVRNSLTLLNRVQEHFFRASVFDAMMRAQIEAKGLDPLTELAGDTRQFAAKMGEQELNRMVGTAVSAALDYTFAADPLPGTAPSYLLQAFQKTPVLSFLLQLGQPFPRFNFVSAPRWVWDHFPLQWAVDVPLAYLRGQMGDSNPIFRGRWHQMEQVRQHERTMLDLDTQVQRTKYQAAEAQQAMLQAFEESKQAAAVLTAIDAKAREAGSAPIPGLDTEIARVKSQLEAAQQTAIQARQRAQALDATARNLERQQEKATQTREHLAAVGAAKSPQEYFARNATGLAMAAAGYAFWQWKTSQSRVPGEPDTQWYEMPLDWVPEHVKDLAGVTGQKIDLRAFAPEIQTWFLSDFLADVAHNTEWGEAGPEALSPKGMGQFMREHYHGKYTSPSFMKAALEAYVSMSPAAGSTRELQDLLTGKIDAAPGGKSAELGDVQDILLTMAGQYFSRFSSPLSAINDVTGQFSEEERKLRLPQEGEQGSSWWHQLLDPTIANIPVLRRTIPEKIDAITGQPMMNVDPLARQLGGVTKRLENPIEQELLGIGLGKGAALPRQTGDREFDNQVNKIYAGLIQEYLPQVTGQEWYQALTPELKRDVLMNGVPGSNGQPGESGLIPRLKRAAVQQALAALEEAEPGSSEGKLDSPAMAQKKARWQQHAEQISQEEAAGNAASDQAERIEGASGAAFEAGQAAGQEAGAAEPGAPPLYRR